MINGSEVCLVSVALLGVLAFCPPSITAMPVSDAAGSAAAESASNPNGLQSDFDYSRFFFKPEGGEKRAVQPPAASFGDRFLGQWHQAGSLPRHLAPKFKREFETFMPNDKRLDEQYMDDFYSNLKPSRYEWNFNRL